MTPLPSERYVISEWFLSTLAPPEKKTWWFWTSKINFLKIGCKLRRRAPDIYINSDGAGFKSSIGLTPMQEIRVWTFEVQNNNAKKKTPKRIASWYLSVIHPPVCWFSTSKVQTLISCNGVSPVEASYAVVGLYQVPCAWVFTILLVI